MITEPQARVLKEVLTDTPSGGYGGRGVLGILRRMQARAYVEWDMKSKNGRALTPAGAKALHDWYQARWAKSGCMAYQDDLTEVETLLKSKGFTVK